MKIYLAGPEVFLENAIEIGEAKKQLCTDYGQEGFFPLDKVLDLADLTSFQQGLLISKANEELIDSCDAVIANITPFRGPSADVGTVFELGYAKAKGKIVCGYTYETLNYWERIDRSFPYNNLEGELLDEDNVYVENFNMVDNLMIDGGIRNSGGFILTYSGNESGKFGKSSYKHYIHNDLDSVKNINAFTECLKALVG